MTIGRWNYQTQEYDPYTPPADWKVVLYTENMMTPINCTNCGKHMYYGDSYTSRELHTSIGIGYPVCAECYNDENLRRARHELKNMEYPDD